MEGDKLRYGVRHKFRRISIHALRVEGDNVHYAVMTADGISIHALRVEGDRECKKSQKRHCISIHALRVEGDASCKKTV